MNIELRTALIVVVAISGCNPTSSPPPREERAVFCLSTEFLPDPPQITPDLMRHPLTRELGRQAVLIAARDGLGLPTRDESLGEVFVAGNGGQTAPFHIAVRPYNGGNCSLKLSPIMDTADDATIDNAKLERTFHFKPDTYNMYKSLTQVLGSASRTDLVETLSAAGLKGESVSISDGAPLPDGVAQQLDQLNFVSQYAAARAIHDAIIEDGESLARLGGLVRAYTNLSLLSQHHWSSADSAFAARALLYSERLVALNPQDSSSYWHRAYARALIGLHRAALEDIAVAERMPAAGNDAPPAWSAVIEPFCKFDIDKLATLSATSGLSELAPQLVFELKSYYTLPRWTGEAGYEVMAICPEAYHVYARVADHSEMAFQRMATRSAAANFGERVPRRVALLLDLPPSVQEMLAEIRKPGKSPMSKLSEGRAVGDPYSELPFEVASALRDEVATNGDRGEPSWEVLAQLIRDEQFIELANTLEVAQNAVEHSNTEMVNAFMPLVEGHPYAPYIQSFAFNQFQQPEERKQQYSQLALQDPRMRMRWVIYSYPESQDANGVSFSDHSAAAIWLRDYRLPAMVEALGGVNDDWFKNSGLIPHFQRQIEDLEAISPHCPQVLRLRINTTPEPTDEQLAEWESQSASDSLSLYKVGNFHYARGDYADAIRCYERSYELCPDVGTSTALAEAYRKNNQDDKWLPTLERYLAARDYALGHSSIHLHIAKDYSNRGKWKEAEPHAMAGAQVWSSDGLTTASRVSEGLGKWAESERWIREAVENYPSYQGLEWYLWCRRTGRGDLQQAKQYADRYRALPAIRTGQSGVEAEFVCAILDENQEDALKLLQSEECLASDSYYWLHAALLAKKLGDNEVFQAQMAKVMDKADGYKESDRRYYGLVKLLYDHRDEPLPAQVLAEADELLAKFVAWSRCNYEYFIGEFLALESEQDKAEEYWRRAVTNGPFEKWNSTFAGDRLVKKYGSSRPDDDAAVSDESL